LRLLRMWPNLLGCWKFWMLKLKSEDTIISAVKFLWWTALVATFGIKVVKWCLKNKHRLLVLLKDWS
jgi:hypothetical protein